MDVAKCSNDKDLVTFVNWIDKEPNVFIDFQDHKDRPGRLQCFDGESLATWISDSDNTFYRLMDAHTSFEKLTFAESHFLQKLTKIKYVKLYTGEFIIYDNIVQDLLNIKPYQTFLIVATFVSVERIGNRSGNIHGQIHRTYRLSYKPIDPAKMKKGIVSDDVVYVNSTQTKKYPGLKSAIDELTKKCGYVSDLCGVYNSCYSFMGICFDRTIEKKYIEKELSNPKGIVGYFLIVLFPSLIEIYNVCVDPDNRRKGIGTKMMKSITTLDNSILYGDGRGMVNLWLGVDIANPMAEKAGLMYLKSGFRCEKVIKNITPGGQKAPYHIPFWFDRNIEYSYNQDDFIQLIHGIEKTTNQCEIKLVFTKSIFDYIRPMLNDVMEHSGYFKIKSVKDGVGILSIPIKDVKKGTANYAHVPLAFNEFINFHTHPQICYSKYDCVLGWPSSIDMAKFIENYVDHNTVGSMVISVEGVYLVYLTLELQKFLNLFQYNYGRKISSAVRKIYEHIDKKRKIRSEEDILNKYIEFTRKIKLKDLDIATDQIYEDNKEIKLFNLAYMPWSDIDKRKNINVTIKYLSKSCDIKIDPNIDRMETVGGEIKLV